MSSIQHSASSKSNSSFDELRWVTQIRRTLEEELEDDSEVPVSIFNVPKILMASDLDSYTPQEVAIGPYHFWRPELYEMERYKLTAAKRAQKHLKNLKFQDLVQQLTKHEHRIRACYHKYLDVNGETLAWMMAMDASFLLEFLQVYANLNEEKVLRRLSSRMSHLVDYARRKSAHNTILRDIVMLENQIPLFVLIKMLEFQFSSLEAANDMLLSMLSGFSQELSPFKMMDVDPHTPNTLLVSDFAHLLDFLYQMITPKIEAHADEIIDVVEDGEGNKESSFGNSNSVKQLLHTIWKVLSKLNKGPMRLLKRILFSRPLKVFLKLPWTILSNLPGLRMLKAPTEMFFSQANKEEAKPENDNSSNKTTINKPPLIEEITIPSVTELSKSGVRFSPTNGSLSTITFDPKTVIFYLPTISLDVNTEAILRNLIAYEASNAYGPLVFTRYTELMNGIIDTEDDVKLLRERGVILNRLKSDEEVANLWNGMSKSIRLTKVPFLDKVIEDVNTYHNGRWKVKFGKFMKLYVFGSWRFLTLLAAVLMLLLMGLQAFCSVYTCARIFHVSTDDN
ncbi:hypothetical protein L484_025683 [Morus notabilis]|uniref:Uncharacterized protein n=1 Tax=Morus notabilis TaxID=981085 RepID=W9RBW3_9ROSA|nr:putative UPF0481 protein At3g02645 [Morus notabilis]EXB67205.1 hypothetical protein L484_025683 [Morus notabilis]